MNQTSRRSFLIGGTSMAVLASRAGMASAAPNMTVYHDPNCGCCGGWVAHMRKAGFQVQVIDTDDLAAIKIRFRVPTDLASCHTAEVSETYDVVLFGPWGQRSFGKFSGLREL